MSNRELKIGHPQSSIIKPMSHLILASRSPQRVNLLREAGYVFDMDPADIDENDFPSTLSPEEVAQHLAIAKARRVASRHPDDFVLAADTVVALGETMLGKPDDAAHAYRMIASLSGSTHRVITGVALVNQHQKIELADRVVSTVEMRKLSEKEIADYVATRLWEGKAGGYGIQDHDPFVTCMHGSLSNIVGLPMERTVEMLRQCGM